MKKRFNPIKDKSSEILSAIRKNTEAIENVEKRMDEGNADQARRSILAFDDELRRDVEHSEESFNQVLQDIRFYRHYCRDHEEYENDKATSAKAHILETYQRVKNENKFI